MIHFFKKNALNKEMSLLYEMHSIISTFKLYKNKLYNRSMLDKRYFAFFWDR
jgi:hypothetical protein